jgi:5-methylcytosine-specific restriction endonuclease McrA
MSFVFLVDTTKKPLNPVHPGQARLLLKQGKAAVFRRYPFTLILKAARSDVTPEPLLLKIDPGSKTTGLAIVNDANGTVVWAAELTQRGEQVRKHQADRRAVRRSQRRRKTCYRKTRFDHRRRKPGWLPPLLVSRIASVTARVSRLRRRCPLAALSQELVRFDSQLMQNPVVTGVEYQQGTLAGYETREYLLENWQWRCAYCKQADVPLAIEHLRPRARGASNRVSNLALSCPHCNQRKGTQTTAEFGFPELQAQAQVPLKNAAAANATRWVLHERLTATGLPVESGTGGRTKLNCTLRNLPKTYWTDAACVGASTPEVLQVGEVQPLFIEAPGWHSRQMCLMDKPGFPRARAKQQSPVKGFHTADMARAVVSQGVKVGTCVGRVAVRTKGSFNEASSTGTVQGIAARYCHLVQQRDGSRYAKGGSDSSPSPEGEESPLFL